jgi:hypothetical protein
MAERVLVSKSSEKKFEAPTSIIQKPENTRSIKSSALQAKLRIGQPNDIYEQEADRVAEQIMRMPDPAPQRKCYKCNQDEKKVLQTKKSSGNSPLALGQDVPTIVQDVLHSPGQPLDSATRAFMEPRFGHDFSGVRVHTDAQAAKSARAVEALAYTVGKDVVFGDGQFALYNPIGQKLLAHELAHVVQQNFAPSNVNIKHDQADAITRSTESVVQTMLHNNSSLSTSMSYTCNMRLQRVGANPGCSAAQARDIHQAIFDARGWINKVVPKLEARPLSDQARASLRRNFGPTYGVEADAKLIANRLRIAYREMSTIPFSCAGVGDPTCAAGHCGYAPAAGSHSAVICTNVTLSTNDAVFRAGCLLHESLHAAFSRFNVDEYSGWHGHSSSTATFPGNGTDPLLNADSYTTLTMDLSGR